MNTKRLLFALAAGAAGMAFAAEPALIWQLGKTDGSDRDFTVPYHAWEYGSAPAIQRSKAMDHAAQTFHYTIAENKAYPAVPVVSGLYTISEQSWMLKDEMVCNLSLKWNEKEAGRRLLTVNCSKAVNMHGGTDGIEVRLPGGEKKIFNVPAGVSEPARKNSFSFSVAFDAKKGENTLVIANVSRAKHYAFHFDSISLTATNRMPDFKPLLELSLDCFSGIAHPGEKVHLNCRLFNQKNGTVSYTVRDFDGKVVVSGQGKLKNGLVSIQLPTKDKGHFSVECRAGDQSQKLSYVVVEPVKAEYLPDSRFGCHALSGDGYRPRYNEARHQLKIRRAFLGGAKWARLHSVSWALREPKKGVYDWRFLDEQLALAEKYKLIPLVGIGQVPEWSSTSKDRSLTCCGNYSYLYYPPENMQDWANFVQVFVKRYGKQVKHIEIGNEPGYSSAFWTNGSAPDFGRYLKTAYEAIKKSAPDTVVYPGAPLQVDFLDEATKSSGGVPKFDVLSAHYLGNQKRGSAKPGEWRRLMVKMNKKQEFINSEDMQWVAEKKDPVRLAANMIQVHVRDAASGIFRTFAFQAFDDNSSSGYSFFDLKDYPRPAFAAYRAMTHRLEHAGYVGDLSGAEFEAYLFDRQGTPVVVFWKEPAGKVSLPLGTKSAKLVDMMDRENSVVSSNGVFTLDAAYAPQFIEGGDLAFLTNLASAMKTLPKSLMVKDGKPLNAVIRLASGVVPAGLKLPEGWQGSFTQGKLTVSPKAGAMPGRYDGAFLVKVNGRAAAIPMTVEVTSGVGGNLFRNGDLEQGSAHYYYPKDKTAWAVLPGVGVNGSQAIRSKGMTHFGSAGSFKVRYGEKYLVAYDIRGEGICGLAASVADAKGKRLYPQNIGINMLSVKAGPEWKRVSEVVNIIWPDAAKFGFAFLVNYGDKTGKVAYIDNITVARLTDTITPSKVLNQGVFAAPETPVVIDGEAKEWSHVPAIVLNTSARVVCGKGQKWNGPADLSCKARVMLDEKNLYLLFEVTDDKFVPSPSAVNQQWEYDSIQFALDPFNDNRGNSEFALGQAADGKPYLYKQTNYWTPELPENITRVGLIKGAEIVCKPVAGGMVYEVRIPINEVYPLKGKESDFGFNFLVNDNDGSGRKYMEWSGGIGQSKDPGQYGSLQRKK